MQFFQIHDRIHPVELAAMQDFCSMLRDLGETPTTFEQDKATKIQFNQYMATQSTYLIQPQQHPNPLFYQYVPRHPIPTQ